MANNRERMYRMSLDEYLRKNPQADASRSNTAAVLNAAGNSVAEQTRAILGNNSPTAAKKMASYQTYKNAGGQGLSSEATKQLYSPSFFMPEKLKGYDAVASNQAYKDQLYFQNMHRNEGLWDVSGNRASLLSDNFLQAEIAALADRIKVSQQKDEEWKAGSVQAMADYEKAAANASRWKQMYPERMRGYEDPQGLSKIPNGQAWGDELAAQEQNWLMAKYLLGDQATDWQDFYANEMARLEGLSDDEYYAEMDELDAMFQALDWKALMNPQKPTYDSQTGKLEKLLEEYQAEQKYRNNLAYYRGVADQTHGTIDLAKYYVDNIEGYDPNWFNPANFTNAAYYINNSPTANAQNIIEQLTDSAGERIIKDFTGILTDEDAAMVREYYDKGYDYLLPEEIAVYNDLLNTDPMMAQVFLDNMEGQLRERKIAYDTQETQLMASDSLMGAAMSATTILSNPYAALQTTVAAMAGEDKNSAAYDLTRDNQVTRMARAEEWGKLLPMEVFGQPLGSTVYNTIVSMGDMLMANKIGTGFSRGMNKAAQGTMQAIISSEVMASTIYEDLQKGYTNDQSLLHGLANGVIEAWMEKGFMDELFSGGKGFSTRSLRSALAEGAEEVGSEFLQTVGNEFAAYLTGNESEIQRVYESFKNTLPYGEDAGLATLQYYANQFATAGLSGFAMGGGVATVTGAGEYADNVARGSMMKQSGDIQRTLSIAQEMGEGTESTRIGRELQAKLDKKKKLSTYDMGRLTAAIEADTNEELAQAPNKVMEAAIEERLVELGEDAGNAKKLAPVIRKVYRGQNVNRGEIRQVSWSDNAEQVVKELTRDTTAEDAGRVGVDWAQKTKAKAAEATGKVMAKAVERGQAVGQIRRVEDAEQTESRAQAVDNAVQKGAAKVKVTKGTKAPATTSVKIAYDDGSGVKEGNAARFVEKDGEVQLEVKTEGGSKTVTIDDIKSAEGSGIAAIAAYVEDANAGAEGTHQMSAQEASTMLQVYQTEGGDVGTFIRNFEDAYLAGYAGTALVKGAISTQAAKIAYEQGKAEANVEEEKRVARATSARAASKGAVAWLGKVTSNSMVKGAGDEEALSGAMEGMTEGQRTTVEVVKAFANTFKTNVVLFESDEQSISRVQNGSFDQLSNTLYIDVNAGAYTAEDVKEMRAQGTLGYAMMKVLGHEVTHYLEANSAEGYANYKAAVKQELRTAGRDWAELVRGKIEAARLDGRKMTYAGAEAEVVADASEYMLQSSKFVQQIEKGVRGTVKRIVQNFMQKLQDVFSKLSGGSKESMALRKLYDGVYKYTGNLQELWDAAMEETLAKPEAAEESSETAEMVEDLKPVTQFQGRTSVEKREDGLMAMHNLNYRKLLDTLRLGGFPMPSIAIVKARQGHTMYGDYSVIFAAETIDPKGNADNRVYGNDAWTPIFPPVETELDSDRVLELRRDTKALVDNVDSYLGQMVSRFYNNFVGESVTNETEDNTLEKAWRNEGMLAAYLLENGREVQVLQHEVPADRGYKPEYAEIYDAILGAIGDSDTTGMSGGKLLEAYGEQLAAANDILNRMWQRYNDGDRRSGIAILNRIRQAEKYDAAGRDLNPLMETVKDYDATADTMRNQINKDSFDRWMLNNLNQFFKRKGIYNGKERFTSSGNRKSWAATHYAYTVDNVVRAMLQQEESDIQATNASGLKAAASTMYKDLDEIRADSYRLGKVSEEEFNARMAKADNDFRDFLNAIQAWDYDVQEEAGNLLVHAAKKRYKAQEIVDLFKANGFKRITLNAAKIAESVIRQVQTIPTGYFEAKPARVVTFDEVRMVVAPQDMPADLATKLDELGIPYTLYDGTDADRLRKANAVENVQFSSRTRRILNNDEYARLQSNWTNYKYRGYNYFERANGGIVVDFDNTIVYTDANGEPEYVIDVSTDDRWSNNDVYNLVVEMEEADKSHEVQRRILKSLFGTEGARFRTGGKRERTGRKDGKAAGRNAGSMGQGNHGQVPEQEVRQYSPRTPGDTLTIREYLGEMKPTARMNETEKILLKRYQEQLKILREKEQLVAEQEEIIRTAPVPSDELTMAKNRYQIYRAQANRAARALSDAERSDGFARLMATSQEVVNRYLLGSAGNVADAADALDADVAELTRQLKAVEADVTRSAQASKTAFARGLFDQKTLNAAAQKLKDAYGSRMAVKTIADRLALVYGEIYADNGAEGAKRFAEAARDLAEDILTGHKYRYKSEILPMLQEKIGTISLTETDVQEIANAGMTVSEYKRAIGPWVKVAEGASDLSSYASNAEYYGDGTLAAILGDATEGDLAMKMLNTIQQEKAQEQEIGVDGMSEGEMITVVMADIAGSDLPLSTNSKTTEYLRNELKKFAGDSTTAAQNIEQAIMNAKKATARASDVWRAAVAEVNTAKAAVEYYRKLEDQRRLTELKELRQSITEELKTENARKLAEKVEAQRKEYREREQKARAYRRTRDEVDKLRRKIGRDVKRLNTLRVRETDQKHVPQELQHVADAVMRTFTDSALSRLAFSAEKTASLQRTYQILGELESDTTHYWDDEIQQYMNNLVSLSEAYNAIRNREAGAPSYMSLEGVVLEREILQGVDNIVSNVLHLIDAANRNFLTGRQETFEAYANRTGEKLAAHKDAKVLRGVPGKWQVWLDETFRTGNVTPVYFFEHLDNPEIMQVFDEIRKGQSRYARIVAEGKAFVEETKNRYNYGAWVADGKLQMKTHKDHTIELTREEAAEIYAVYKREQANKLYRTEHLLKGGFQFRNIAEKGEGIIREKDTPHQLDAADMAKIGAWLTDEQKAYADALVGYLSTNMADYGNEASMAMFGYKKFTESYYIPFKTAANQRYQRGDEGPQGENAGTGRLKNSDFTHRVQHKANQTLVIGGITDTVADHIHKMAAYAAMVKPIEDMKRLLNHKVVEEDGTTNTIRAMIGQKYGKASEDYLTQLLKDLNGATQSDTRAAALTDRLIGAFKRGAVLASASVVLQQPTAMARAMAYISPKYFTQNPFYRPSKGTWNEMMKHAGTAVIKDMGKFDVGLGLTAAEYITDENLKVMETYHRLKTDSKTKAGKAAYDRFMEKMTSAPGLADQWTWGLIWKAVKAEQAAKHPGMDVNSEAFLQMCGARFDDVIDRTQVYDSVLTRSNLMRSSNALHKMATSFMSEPTLSINMLYDAMTGKHKGTQRAAIIGSVVASQVLAGAMAALVQAFNDDDDKRNWAEKYADRATGNILDNLNPLGMIPYASDIVSMFQGYDVERPDMTVIADLMDYTKTFLKAFEDGGVPTWKQWENFAGTWANLVGVPGKNMSREVRRMRNAVLNTDWSSPTGFNVGQAVLENVPGYDAKNKAYYDRIVAAELDGDVQRAEDYREYLLMSKTVSEDALKSGLKKAVQERFIAGDADADTAIAYLQKIGASEDENDAYWEVDKWQYMQETGNAAGDYRKYDAFFQAVETGNDMKATIKEYLDNGVSKTTLATQITNRYKQQLIDLKKAGKGYADLQARILTAYEALGYDREKKLKDIQKWFK